MKKVLAILVSLVVIFSTAAFSVSATESAITLAGPEKVNEGSSIEFIVSISGCPDATSASVNISLDDGLSLVSGEWQKEGMIKSFFVETSKGALGGLNSPNINGSLFKFTVKGDTASLTKQSISVTVTAKNGSDEIFNKTAQKEVLVESLTKPDNHTNTVIKNKKNATCTEDGYTGDVYCADCGKLIKKGTTVKAAGHKYSNGKCSVCGAKDPNYQGKSPKTGEENTYIVLLSIFAAAMMTAVLVLPNKKKSGKHCK